MPRKAARKYRLLLDQNFPNPPGFDIADVDDRVEVTHLWEYDPTLTEAQTPDWFIYLRAAADKFDAVVTRDLSQVAQPEEMWVLTRIRLTLVTFRKPIEDPVVEWGQLLAYLPQIRSHTANRRASRIVLLPRPLLQPDSIHSPTNELRTIADEMAVTFNALRDEAGESVLSYLDDHDVTELAAPLRWKRRGLAVLAETAAREGTEPPAPSPADEG